MRSASGRIQAEQVALVGHGVDCTLIETSARGERSSRRAPCCAFLDLDLRRDDDRLVLDVTGPADARPLITGLFA